MLSPSLQCSFASSNFSFKRRSVSPGRGRFNSGPSIVTTTAWHSDATLRINDFFPQPSGPMTKILRSKDY